MNKNDIFEIDITGTTDEGDGVGRAEGIVVFVPYALYGERVRVLIVKVMKNHAAGKLLEVIRPSELRIKSECVHFYKCGGCSFQIGGLNIDVPPCVGSRNISHYRNKAQLPVSADGIGMFARHSHRVIDMDSCLIQDARCGRVISCVRGWMHDFGIEPYCEETDRGEIRHIYTRSGESGMMVCIVTKSAKLPHPDELVSRLRADVPNLCGVLQNINERKTNVVLGREFKTLWGNDNLTDRLGKFRFRLSPQSFYQVNREQTERLYDIAADFAALTGSEVVWDLYCGIGTIGQYLSEGAKKLVGIEIVGQAVENARENARLNGIENAEYHCGAAEEIAPKLLRKDKPDVIILDPPRKGCAQSLLETAAAAGAGKIVYISCKPSTLARDLKILGTLGYRTERVQPVDLFPRTAHVETVALLKKNK